MSRTVEPKRLELGEDTAMPNNPALPVLVYPQVMDGDIADKADAFEKTFRQNGWRGTWRNGIYNFHHFHPDAHEALGIASGKVTVQLGGHAGETLDLEAGDLLVLPAGTGHKRLSASDDLVVVGAYPEGQQNYHLCRDKAEMHGSRSQLANVSRPAKDPFYGANGPLTKAWL